MIREKEVSSETASKPKQSIVRLQIASGEAISAPPLSATLGQMQINSLDFCKQFNVISLQKFEAGTLLNVKLYKNSDNSYFFKINGISKSFLFFQLADSTKFIPVENLYDIFTIFARSEFNTSDLFGLAKEFFGNLRSIKFKIIFLLKRFTKHAIYNFLFYSTYSF